ncbi:PEP-CTERM sorting domain-containing protein [Trichocoleus sp. FACHB-90]|uniref:PEP-CTERM sorting domain-containing protein n=1 Tax=Cyanophyceae TaxID=3028117 RepID=UPI00168A1836|nr:PEP-CTERM sorting domain-containing protein [Trichocoleus sp. FACHB-90]MBD1928066.1 PEP-CTERM sorting domain-containing protein [Trichocoleus sp. FACHB-90]
MKKLAQITAISVIVAGLSSVPAQAATFTESDDAGETLSTAQILSTMPMPLKSISGMLSGDADLFQIFLTGGQTFSATTVGRADFDTQLFLFDKDGFGVYSNDESTGSIGQSTLPMNSPFTPTKSGIYYLGISGFDYDPVSDKGEIFPDFPDFPDVAFDAVVGATGFGGDSPLKEFDGAILSSGGSYTIALTGVETAGNTSIPEPSSVLGILALGALGASRLKNQKNNQKTGNSSAS